MAKHFNNFEFMCNCGCGGNFISPQLVAMLDNARAIAGIPFIINSACRCEKHNKTVGGVADSAHLAGLAVDIAAQDGQSRFLVIKGLLEAGFTRIGINFTKNFIHTDIDKAKPQNTIFKY